VKCENRGVSCCELWRELKRSADRLPRSRRSCLGVDRSTEIDRKSNESWMRSTLELVGRAGDRWACHCGCLVRGDREWSRCLTWEVDEQRWSSLGGAGPAGTLDWQVLWTVICQLCSIIQLSCRCRIEFVNSCRQYCVCDSYARQQARIQRGGGVTGVETPQNCDFLDFY